MLMKVNVNPARFDKLNIRQYSSGLIDEEINDLIKLSENAKGDPFRPGFQCSIFGDPDDTHFPLFLGDFDKPVVKKLEQSFVNACQNYLNLKGDYEARGWISVSWTDFEIDLKNQGRTTKVGPFWHNHTYDRGRYDYYRLSGVLYLTLPEGSTTTRFSNQPDIKKKDFFDLPYIINEWFIYHAMLPHLPGDPGKTNKKRICVAADYWIK